MDSTYLSYNIFHWQPHVLLCVFLADDFSWHVQRYFSKLYVIHSLISGCLCRTNPLIPNVIEADNSIGYIGGLTSLHFNDCCIADPVSTADAANVPSSWAASAIN